MIENSVESDQMAIPALTGLRCSGDFCGADSRDAYNCPGDK
jgi:hypothetical protein